MRFFAWLLVPCIIVSLMISGVLTAMYAAYALFWLSPKALVLCLGAMAITIALISLLNKIVLPFLRH